MQTDFYPLVRWLYLLSLDWLVEAYDDLYLQQQKKMNIFNNRLTSTANKQGNNSKVSHLLDISLTSYVLQKEARINKRNISSPRLQASQCTFIFEERLSITVLAHLTASLVANA